MKTHTIALCATILFLAPLGSSQEAKGDLRETAADPWARGLPDGEDLVSGSLESNFPDWDLTESGNLPADPEAEAGGEGAAGTSAGSGSHGRGSAGRGRVAATSYTETEPNDAFGSAQSVSPTSSITASIDPLRDLDWFGFDAHRRGAIEVSFSRAPGDVNPTFRVHNAEGGALTGWITPRWVDGASEVTAVDLGYAGRYYVVVADDKSDTSSSESYVLQLVYLEGDDFEPNDSFGTHTAVSPNARVSGTILPKGDLDRYGFKIERRGSIEIEFTQVPDAIEPAFRIHNAEGGAITGWMEPKLRDGAAEVVVVDLPKAGVYHVLVADSKSDARSEEPYTLHLTMHLGDPNEWNDSIGTATPTEASSSWNASILPMGDYDYYAFDVANQGILTVGFDRVPADLSLTFRVHNAEGGALTGWTQPSVKNDKTEPAVVDLNKPGRYYIVYADERSDSRAFESFGVSLKHDAGDAHEPNASIGKATRITLGATVSGSILPKGDYDYYAFDVGAGTHEVVFPRVPDALTPSFRIHNPNGGAITGWTNPKVRDGASEPFEFEVKDAGRYFLVVADDDNSAYSMDSYSVIVR